MSPVFKLLASVIALGSINAVSASLFLRSDAQVIPRSQDTRKQGEKSVAAQSDQQLLKKRIIEVLNSTAIEAKKWDDKAIAARTQAQISDLIWDTNDATATDHLKAAWDAAAKVENPKRNPSPIVN
jgi:hypothetical protein